MTANWPQTANDAMLALPNPYSSIATSPGPPAAVSSYDAQPLSSSYTVPAPSGVLISPDAPQTSGDSLSKELIYEKALSSSGARTEDGVLDEEKGTWSRRRLVRILAVGSVLVEACLALATVGPIKTPMYSWVVTTSLGEVQIGIGSAVVNMPNGVRPMPLWRISTATPLMLWLAAHIATIVSACLLTLTLVFMPSPESEQSLMRLRLFLFVLALPLVAPLVAAYVLLASDISHIGQDPQFGFGGLLLDIVAEILAGLAVLLAIRLKRDPYAAEKREEMERMKLEQRLEKAKVLERRQNQASKRKAAKEIVKDPALAFLLLSRRRTREKSTSLDAF